MGSSEPDLLKLAVENGHLDTARWLSKHGSEINLLDLVEMAGRKDNIPLLRYLTEYGPPLDLRIAKEFWRILWWISETDRVQVVLEALKKDDRQVLLWIFTRTRFEDELSRQIICDGIQHAPTKTLLRIQEKTTDFDACSWCLSSSKMTKVESLEEKFNQLPVWVDVY
ncbi:LOW QUALITY PROTEIN: hypothetical protein PHMEG_00035912 [Phytophthora megakarya]|uniref:Uncharacterized protein n=1 Tax=Phytophthora megakarya TaxID=4795 RepID=A0A225UQG2_9STRA|nr:LOW QUALITY PROTEIN: hypothetical protein PHMEG_00035912 [Phytophthora megakarya]